MKLKCLDILKMDCVSCAKPTEVNHHNTSDLCVI